MKKIPNDETRKRRMERGKAKLQLERERRKIKREANASKVKEEARAALGSINNEKAPMTLQNQKNKVKTASKSVGGVGTSKKNKKWKQKGVQRYNARVWRGWRESEENSSPVITYNAKDLET